MGLILIGGYYNKEDALKILRNLKYYTKDLLPVEHESPRGLFALGEYYSYIIREEYLIEKMLLVRSVVEKHGDAALDRWEELTEYPDENNPIFDRIGIVPDTQIQQIIRDALIPMKKDEFKHYLDIYNQFYNERDTKENH